MNRIKGMSQTKLGIELSVTRKTISAYEHGKHLPSTKQLLKMSSIFNASCDYILGFSNVKSIDKTLNDD